MPPDSRGREATPLFEIDAVWGSRKRMESTRPLTELLRASRSGDETAADQAYARVYDELKSLARMVRFADAGQTSSTTALVHEAWIKLATAQGVEIDSRLHFRRLAARAMRQIVVDAARARSAAKRGAGANPVTFDDALPAAATLDAETLIDLDDYLRELARVDPRAASVVECRFFGELDVQETATALDISTATVKRDWRAARAWLGERLRER